MAEVARQSKVSLAHVSYTVGGARTSERVMRIARRLLARAERGKFKRAA